MQRDWDTLGPKLRGKIHLYCGTLGNYHPNNAVKLTKEFLDSAANPPGGNQGEVLGVCDLAQGFEQRVEGGE